MIYCEVQDCRGRVSRLFNCANCHILVCEKCWKASHREHNLEVTRGN